MVLGSHDLQLLTELALLVGSIAAPAYKRLPLISADQTIGDVVLMVPAVPTAAYVTVPSAQVRMKVVTPNSTLTADPSLAELSDRESDARW